MGDIWFNQNVAGSYAPSSIRSQSPLRKVCAFSGNGRKAAFNLIANHSEGAETYMLFGGSIPAIALSAFLYRDYSFRGEAPTANDLVSIFRNEFGFRKNHGDEDDQIDRLFDIAQLEHHGDNQLFANI